MATNRLFIALSLPRAVCEVLAELATEIPGVRWTPVDQLHLTLRFLGDVPTERIEPFRERLGQIRVKSFLLPVESVGAFPPKGPPRVLWSGVGSGHPRLHQLRQRIDDSALAAGLDPDLRSFAPHVSLARCDENAGTAVAHWLRSNESFEGPSFFVEAFDLYSSELRPAGAFHELLAGFPLMTWPDSTPCL